MYSNAFRLNIRAFLAGPWARRVPIAGVHKAAAYIIQLRSPQGTTLLHVYEERLTEKDGAICDQCRCMGEQQRVLHGFRGRSDRNGLFWTVPAAAEGRHGDPQVLDPHCYCCAVRSPTMWFAAASNCLLPTPLRIITSFPPIQQLLPSTAAVCPCVFACRMAEPPGVKLPVPFHRTERVHPGGPQHTHAPGGRQIQRQDRPQHALGAPSTSSRSCRRG